MAHAIILFDKGRKTGDFGRLHVGFRGSDWTKVWYQPAPEAEEDEDGTIEMGLFKLSTGGPSRREPMDGEVVWLPHFDLNQFKSKKGREKERLQKQFIHDAWRYLAETDLNLLRQMEQELDDPFNRQRQSWFEEAKKWKASRVRGRGKRRTSRVAVLARAGIENPEELVNSDTSDDSTYESEDDFVRDKPMPPPPPPRTTTKRKAGGNGGGGPPAKKSPNKPKTSPGDKSKARSRASDQDFPMSGGLSGSSGPRRHLGGNLFGGASFGSRTNITGLDNDSDHEDEDDNASRSSSTSQPWDNRPPEPPLPHRSASRNGSASRISPSAQRAAGQAAMRRTFQQPPGHGGNEDALARQANGNVNEDEAVERAMKESTIEAENRRDGGQGNNQNGAHQTGENKG